MIRWLVVARLRQGRGRTGTAERDTEDVGQRPDESQRRDLSPRRQQHQVPNELDRQSRDDRQDQPAERRLLLEPARRHPLCERARLTGVEDQHALPGGDLSEPGLQLVLADAEVHQRLLGLVVDVLRQHVVAAVDRLAVPGGEEHECVAGADLGSQVREDAIETFDGGIGIECSTYSRLRTRMDEFTIVRDTELTSSDRFRFLKRYPVAFMPTIVASAVPGGPVERKTYEAIKAEFLKRLDQKVTIQIRPHQPGEPYQEIGFSM